MSFRTATLATISSPLIKLNGLAMMTLIGMEQLRLLITVESNSALQYVFSKWKLALAWDAISTL